MPDVEEPNKNGSLRDETSPVGYNKPHVTRELVSSGDGSVGSKVSVRSTIAADKKSSDNYSSNSERDKPTSVESGNNSDPENSADEGSDVENEKNEQSLTGDSENRDARLVDDNSGSETEENVNLDESPAIPRNERQRLMEQDVEVLNQVTVTDEPTTFDMEDAFRELEDPVRQVEDLVGQVVERDQQVMSIRGDIVDRKPDFMTFEYRGRKILLPVHASELDDGGRLRSVVRGRRADGVWTSPVREAGHRRLSEPSKLRNKRLELEWMLVAF